MDIGAILRFKTLVEGADKVAAYGNSLDQLQSKVTKLAAGYLSIAGAQKAWDIAKDGAAINQTRESFERMNQEVFKTPGLLNEMREATRGTISDVDLMRGMMTLAAGTTDEMARTMADVAPRLLEIAKAANKLNPSLGDTNFLYQSLAVGIKRSSPMIIDNTGLQLRLGQANQAYAESLGKTVEELTAFERTQALINATLEAGGRLIEQVGGNVDSATDAYARLGVIGQGAFSVFKSTAATEAADRMGVLADKAGETADNYERAAFWAGKLFGGILGSGADAAATTTTRVGTLIDLETAAGQLDAVDPAAARRIYNESFGRYLQAFQEAATTDTTWADAMAKAHEDILGQYEDALRKDPRFAGAARTAGSRAGRGFVEGIEEETDGREIAQAVYPSDIIDAEIEKGLQRTRQRQAQAAREAAAARREEMLAWQQELQETGRAAFVGGIANLDSPDALVTPSRTVSVTTGGLSSEDAALLERYKDLAADAQGELDDIAHGIGTFGVEQDKLNERIEEANGLLGHYNDLMAPLAGVTGEVSTRQQEMTVNAEALNKLLFDQAVAANADSTTLAAVGIATGQMTEAQAEALIVTEALTIRAKILGEQVAAGSLSAEAAVSGLMHYAEQLTATGDSAATAETHISDAQEAYMLLGEAPPVELKVTADVSDALTNIGKAKTALEETGYGYTSYTAALNAQEMALLGGDAASETTVALVGDAEQLQEQRDRIERERTATTVDLVPDSTEVDNEVNRLENYTVYIPTVFVPQNDPTPVRPGGGGGGAVQAWSGGPVTADQLYMVGEHGPELFVPDVGGYIVPNRHLNNYGQTTTTGPATIINQTFISNTREAAALALGWADTNRKRNFNRFMGRDSG